MGKFKLHCPDEELIFPFGGLYLAAISQQRNFRLSATTYKSKVRYRYAGEDWHELEASDYTIEQDFDVNNTNPVSWFSIEFDAEVAQRFPPIISVPAIHEAGDIITVGTGASYPGVYLSGINPIKVQPNYNVEFDFISNSGNVCRKRTISTAIISQHPDSSGKRCRTEEAGSTASNPAIKAISNPRLVADSNKPPFNCNNYDNSCKFSVYLCGHLVLESIKDDCPEVEIIKCEPQLPQGITARIDPWDTVILIEGKVGNLPPLISIFWANIGRIVTAFSFDPTILIELAKEAQTNPNECILALKINKFNKIDILGQFCSTCDCVFPEYQVTCNDGKCPDGTCEVECEDHLCCYDKEGKAVLTINEID